MLPQADSGWWLAVRPVILGAFLVGWAAFAFKNNISSADAWGIIIAIGLVFGVDFTHFTAIRGAVNPKTES